DPMCGSGTVLSAAINRGQRAVGVDIDPLAVLMSQVATAPLEVDELLQTANRVLESARQDGGVKPWEDEETEKFVDFWFGERQKSDLIALMSSIGRVESPEHRSA